MTLIQSNESTEILGASSKNFQTLEHLAPSAGKEELVTDLALSCIKNIEKSSLGWGHQIKKFAATTLSYTAAMTAPFLALMGTLWAYGARVQNIDIATLALGSSAFGGLLLTDLAIGKLVGIRPITACLIASYDAYRHGAKTLSRSVEKSYIDHEKAMKELSSNCRHTLIKDLTTTYLKIATTLHEQTAQDREKFEKHLPQIKRGLSQIGLTEMEVTQILTPIQETLKLLEDHKKLA